MSGEPASLASGRKVLLPPVYPAFASWNKHMQAPAAHAWREDHEREERRVPHGRGTYSTVQHDCTGKAVLQPEPKHHQQAMDSVSLSPLIFAGCRREEEAARLSPRRVLDMGSLVEKEEDDSSCAGPSCSEPDDPGQWDQDVQLVKTAGQEKDQLWHVAKQRKRVAPEQKWTKKLHGSQEKGKNQSKNHLRFHKPFCACCVCKSKSSRKSAVEVPSRPSFWRQEYRQEGGEQRQCAAMVQRPRCRSKVARCLMPGEERAVGRDGEACTEPGSDGRQRGDASRESSPGGSCGRLGRLEALPPSLLGWVHHRPDPPLLQRFRHFAQKLSNVGQWGWSVPPCTAEATSATEALLIIHELKGAAASLELLEASQIARPLALLRGHQAAGVAAAAHELADHWARQASQVIAELTGDRVVRATLCPRVDGVAGPAAPLHVLAQQPDTPQQLETTLAARPRGPAEGGELCGSPPPSLPTPGADHIPDSEPIHEEGRGVAGEADVGPLDQRGAGGCMDLRVQQDAHLEVKCYQRRKWRTGDPGREKADDAGGRGFQSGEQKRSKAEGAGQGTKDETSTDEDAAREESPSARKNMSVRGEDAATGEKEVHSIAGPVDRRVSVAASGQQQVAARMPPRDAHAPDGHGDGAVVTGEAETGHLVRTEQSQEEVVLEARRLRRRLAGKSTDGHSSEQSKRKMSEAVRARKRNAEAQDDVREAASAMLAQPGSPAEGAEVGLHKKWRCSQAASGGSKAGGAEGQKGQTPRTESMRTRGRRGKASVPGLGKGHPKQAEGGRGALHPPSAGRVITRQMALAENPRRNAPKERDVRQNRGLRMEAILFQMESMRRKGGKDRNHAKT